MFDSSYFSKYCNPYFRFSLSDYSICRQQHVSDVKLSEKKRKKIGDIRK